MGDWNRHSREKQVPQDPNTRGFGRAKPGVGFEIAAGSSEDPGWMSRAMKSFLLLSTTPEADIQAEIPLS